MPPLAITAGIGVGTSLLGGLFGRKARKQDEEARALNLQSMKDQSAAAGTMMQSYKDTQGKADQAWGQASPIYQNLLQQYQGMTANPYQSAAPDIERASSNVATQQRDIYQQLGRGPAQQYAASMARLGLGAQSQDMVRNARQQGIAGQSAIADVYGSRSNVMQQLAMQPLNAAGATYGNLSRTNLPPAPASPWTTAMQGLGALAPQIAGGIMGSFGGSGAGLNAGNLVTRPYQSSIPVSYPKLSTPGLSTRVSL